MTIFGSISQIFFAICWFPQVWRVYKTNETRAFSLVTLLLSLLGNLSFFLYVASLRDIPACVTSLVNVVLVTYVVSKTIRNRLERKE